VSVGVQGATDPRMAWLRGLVNLGIELGDVSLRQPTLDEVFLALIGRRPEHSHSAQEMQP
jgi:hypothetical protein